MAAWWSGRGVSRRGHGMAWAEGRGGKEKAGQREGVRDYLSQGLLRVRD